MDKTEKDKKTKKMRVTLMKQLKSHYNINTYLTARMRFFMSKAFMQGEIILSFS